jgi:outer membrane protein assembly factor BamD
LKDNYSFAIEVAKTLLAHMKKFYHLIFILSLASSITACSTSKKDEKISTDPSILFNEGSNSIREGNYKKATEKFEILEREHPASEYAAESTIRKAYSYYLNGQYDESIFASEDFLKQYPTHKSIPYIYYLKALCYYDQIVDLGRDQQLTQEAFDALEEVIIRFPNSKYANDAKLKRDLAFNQLAGKEMNIGLFYLNKASPTAAINRFKTVIDRYETSIFTPEALYRLTEIYYSLGIVDQAKKYASVLGHNYPSSDWYKKAYKLIESGISEPEQSITKRIISKVW